MNLNALAEQLKNGDISLAEWETRMRDFIRAESNTAMILTKGGREFITQADWGYVGSTVKKQYQFLTGFKNDILSNPLKWSTGRLNNRVRQYGQIGYSQLEDFKAREQKKAGFTEERRVLGPVKTEHCESRGDRPGCIELASKGWQPIGTLPSIGAAACYQNCKCKFEYRKPDPENAGGWIGA